MTGKDQTYTIAELAAEFRVTPRTIRFYEDQKLLSPARDGQNRVYSARDRVRLAWIMRGKRTGFSLAEISELLDLYDLGDGRRTQRKMTVIKCRERIDTLRQQREDIDLTISELEDFIRTLEQALPAEDKQAAE